MNVGPRVAFDFHHHGACLLSRLFQPNFQTRTKGLRVGNRHGCAMAFRNFCGQLGISIQRRTEGHVRHGNALAGSKRNAEHDSDPLLLRFAVTRELLDHIFGQ